MGTEEDRVKVYGYRWVVLGVFALINLVVQLQWLTFAPIEAIAKTAYKATTLQIDMLSMIYMIVFIVCSIPASYIIDTYGLRLGVGIGAVLVGLFGAMKWLYADNYTLVFVAQVGLAISQPFVMNAITKVGVRWFPLRERATAAGIASLAQYIGIIIAMILTPILVSAMGAGSELKPMLFVYGAVSVGSALLVLVLLREQPATPPSVGDRDERFRVGQGLRHIFGQPSMILLIILFFVGLGMFNAVSTVIDQIGHMKGLTSDQSGLVGGLMLIGGIVGAIVLPILSDRSRKRKPYLVACVAGMLPGLVGLTVFSDYTLVLISAFVLGFAVMGAGPIGFQYSAEISYPAPESSSQGMILLAGQVSGIIFILGADVTGVTPLLLAFIVMVAACIYLTSRMKESPMIMTEPAQ